MELMIGANGGLGTTSVNGGRRDFLLGDILVEPLSNRITRGAEVLALEPRVMEVLVYLSARPLAIVSKPELIENVWRAHVVDEAIHRAVSLLRSAVGDTPQRSAIIETVPRQGYRLLVTPIERRARRFPQPALDRRWLAAAAIAALALVLAPYALPKGKTEPRVSEPSAVAKSDPRQDPFIETAVTDAPADPTTVVIREPARSPDSPTPRAIAEAKPSFAPAAPPSGGSHFDPSQLAPKAERSAPEATPLAVEPSLRP